MARHAVTCCVFSVLVFSVSCLPVNQDNTMPAKLPKRRSPRSASPQLFRHMDVADTFSAAFSGSRYGSASSSSFSQASAVSLSMGHQFPSFSSLFSSSEEIFDLSPSHRRKDTPKPRPDWPGEEHYDDQDTATPEKIEETTHEHEYVTLYPQKMVLLGQLTTSAAYPKEGHRQRPEPTRAPTMVNHERTTQKPKESLLPTTTPPLESLDDYPIDPRSSVEFGDQVYTNRPETPEEDTEFLQFPKEGHHGVPKDTDIDPGYTITSYSSHDELTVRHRRPTNPVKATGSSPKEEDYHQTRPSTNVSEKAPVQTKEDFQSRSPPEEEAFKRKEKFA